MHFSYFFAGALITNAIPHLTSAFTGKLFPTPFAKPRGKGPSSPLVNYLWGMFNLLIALYQLSRHPLPTLTLTAPLLLMLAGSIPIGIFHSIHFGRVQKEHNY